MIRRVVRLVVLVVVAVALTGCSYESVGERLTRECGEIVDASADTGDAVNAKAATVLHSEIERVLLTGLKGRRSEFDLSQYVEPYRTASRTEADKWLKTAEAERWATTPLRKPIRDKSMRGDKVVEFAKTHFLVEYSAAWQEAFENDLPRRKDSRDKKIRECVWRRGTKENIR